MKKMNKNIWTDTSSDLILEKLKEDLEVDVLIIGGGLTGINTCLALSDTNKKICLVEANKIGSGVTSKMTGKVTYFQGIYNDILKSYDYDTAYKYYLSQKEAIDWLSKSIKEEKLDCDFKSSPSYLYTEDNNNIEKLKKEKDLVNKFGSNVVEGFNLPDGDECKFSINVGDTYNIHPLKYLYEMKKVLLKKGISIFENSRVTDIKRVADYFICSLKDGFIKARSVIVATHYPFFFFPFMMPLKVTLEKSYMSCFKTKKNNFNALSIDSNVKSINYYNDGKDYYKVYLYGSRNISIDTNEKSNFYKLRNKIDTTGYLWSNIDILTGDYLPFIGEIDDKLYIATGYNGWGNTNSVVAALLLRDLILERSNSYSEIFDPKRIIMKSYPKAITSSVKSFIFEKLFYNKEWYDGEVSFEKRGKDDVAIYIDENGVSHVVVNKCPHMKCSLIFNPIEKTWDCPCHGSRFDIDGHVIEGPSNYNICYKEK